MGSRPLGPDYGFVNFVELFSQVLKKKSFKVLTLKAQKSFLKRFEHEVSDHIPIWFRLPLPDN